jgi:hypothetical protein
VETYRFIGLPGIDKVPAQPDGSVKLNICGLPDAVYEAEIRGLALRIGVRSLRNSG